VLNIWNILFGFILGLLQTIINLLPNEDPYTTLLITSQVTEFRTNLSSISWIFPVNDLLLFLTAIITIEITLVVSKVIKWILANISLGFIKQ